MKFTATALLIFVGGLAAIWYFLIRPKAPAPGLMEVEVESTTLEPVPSMTVVNHAIVGEVLVPEPKPYIGEAVAPVVPIGISTAIQGAMDSTDMTTTNADALKQLVDMNLVGYDASTGQCKAGYMMNPFGICQPGTRSEDVVAGVKATGVCPGNIIKQPSTAGIYANRLLCTDAMGGYGTPSNPLVGASYTVVVRETSPGRYAVVE